MKDAKTLRNKDWRQETGGGDQERRRAEFEEQVKENNGDAITL